MPMLVTINTNQGTVTIYGKTNITISFAKLSRIKSLLSGRLVSYVTEVTETMGDDIIELVEDLSIDFVPTEPMDTTDIDVTEINDEQESSQVLKKGKEKLWLHATGSGQLNISDPVLTFNSILDFKPLDKLGYDIFEKYPTLDGLYKKNKLEIVNTRQMDEIKRREADRIAHEDAMKTSIIRDRDAPFYGNYQMMMPEQAYPMGRQGYAPLLPPGQKNVRARHATPGQALPRPVQTQQYMQPQQYMNVDSGEDSGEPLPAEKTELQIMMEASGIDINADEVEEE